MDIMEFFLRLTQGKLDTTNWERVAKLKPEDITRERCVRADLAKIDGEASVLKAKLHSLQADANAKITEWTEHLHQTYSLPRNCNYTLGDENFILVEPKKQEEPPCQK